MTILDEIAENTKRRVAEAKEKISLEEVKKKAYKLPKGDFKFEKTLAKPELSFILECKKASPSKGVIAENFPYLDIAKDYEKAGCDAISVLTEPKWFLGKNKYLQEIAREVSVPVLRKDFTVDEYMIYEAKILHASAVLLIVAILSEEQLKKYLNICNELGLSAIVEIHDETEAEIAIKAGARIIGVNNRNLKDFTVDMDNTRKLRDKIPENILLVSESGMKGAEDIKKVKSMGINAVLIGETLMRAENKKETLMKLKGR